MSKVILKTIALVLILMFPMTGCATTPEPTQLPATEENWALTMPGVETGTYEIEFSCNLEADEEVTGYVQWDEDFLNGWEFIVCDPEGERIRKWSGKDLIYTFDFTVPSDGEYSIRIIKYTDASIYCGILGISPSGWMQTEY